MSRVNRRVTSLSISFLAVGAPACNVESTSATEINAGVTSIASYVERSDRIAFVEIEARDATPQETNLGCGFAYTGRVVRSLKGAAVPDRIQFRTTSFVNEKDVILVFLGSSILETDRIEGGGLLDIRSPSCHAGGVEESVISMSTTPGSLSVELRLSPDGEYLVGRSDLLAAMGHVPAEAVTIVDETGTSLANVDPNRDTIVYQEARYDQVELWATRADVLRAELEKHLTEDSKQVE